MSTLELTQELVDEAFAEAKAEWVRMVDASGMSQTLFFVSSNEATQFIYEYNHYKDAVMEQGFTAPELVDSMTMTVEEVVG